MKISVFLSQPFWIFSLATKNQRDSTVDIIFETLQKHLLQIGFWQINYENIANFKYTFLCWWYVVFTWKKNTSNMEVFTEGHVWWSINQTLSSYTTTACRRSFTFQDWGLQKVNLYGMQEKMIFPGQEKRRYSNIVFHYLP